MRLPALCLRQPAGAVPDKVFDEQYRVVYRWGMAAVDGLIVVLVAWLARRLFPLEGAGEQGLRLLIYLAGTTVLWPLLYDHLDLVLALLLVVALGLLVSRLHYAWSFAVLAAAVNFKLVPLVLAPVWVVGSLPATRPLVPWGPRQAGRLLARGALLAALVLAVFLPLYAAAGGDSLRFFRYHAARGLEVESLWACVPLALQYLGQPIVVDYSYGSVNVHSPLTPLLTRLAAPVTAVLLAGGTSLLLLRARRLTAGADGERPAGTTLAQVYPAELGCYALLFLAVFVCANKVFSPQYLLWLAPLAVLVPLQGRHRRQFLWAFLLICALSTVVAPFLFLFDIIDPTAPDTAPPSIRAPSPRFVTIVLVRNLLFLGWTAALAAYLARRAFAGAGPGAGPGPQKGAARAR